MTEKKNRQEGGADAASLQKRNAQRVRKAALHGFALLLCFCTVVQFVGNRKNALNACSMMVDQLKELILENKSSLRELEETLKEEYIIRADMVADYMDLAPERFRTAGSFSALAEEVQVDEIHIFNRDGIIVNGSIPAYYGYSMDSGDQMAFFKPMLSDTALALCQDVTPNTAAKEPMMYAMVWNDAKDAMIQVGITPERLLDRMKESDLNHLVSGLPVIEGMTVFLVDEETGKVTGSTDQNLIGYAPDVFAKKAGMADGVHCRQTAKLLGKPCYIVYARMDAYDMAVAYTVAAANATLWLSVLEFGLLLMATFLVLNAVVRKNVAELEAQGRELAAANLAKTDFLRRMSHDIRTPINGIRGITTIASHFPDDMEKQAECREKVMQASGFLLELVNHVLNMNKLEAGEMEQIHEPFDLRRIVEESIGIVQMQGAEHALHFAEPQIRIEHAHLIGSALYLKQVLQNIAGNAVKYNRPGGSIALTVEELSFAGGRAAFRFVCADTGCGMSREFLSHAFEAFSQEHNDARTRYTGTGLGLAITKQMVELMGGRISIESTRGEGTTVTTEIPFDVDPDAGIPTQETVGEETRLDGVRVLLVEDNPLNLEIAQFLLEKAGAAVETAANGAEAVARFTDAEPYSFDVILMDIMMPVMDGLAATRAIRALPRTDAAAIPIFAMTANAFREDVRQSELAGMNAHLTKPIQAEELLDTIRKYVHR